MSNGWRLGLAIGGGALALAVAATLALSFGAHDVDLMSALHGDQEARLLLVHARLPRIVLGALAGAALSAVGAALQALLRNPLADPYVLGTSGGAAFGATVAIAIGIPATSLVALPAASFAGAVLATALVYAIARSTRAPVDATSVLLAGVVVNAFASAAITIMKTLVTAAESREMLLWLVGYVGYESWPTLAATTLYVTVGVVVLFFQTGRLNVLSLGDTSGLHLGVDVGRVRATVLLASAFVVAGVVSLTGLIGFVGLVVPHAVRLVVGPDHRLVLPSSALFGGAFVVLADLGARLLFDQLGTEPPVGAVTALIGCPVFLWLLARRTATSS